MSGNFCGWQDSFAVLSRVFSEVTAPITSLLKKDQPFKWTLECESARQFIIKKLTDSPVLRLYDPELHCELHTDASSIGLGGALFQKENGILQPVAYYSRRTTACEARYHSYDLETLAIVEAVEHFRVFLYGKHFTVFTDCNSVRATALKKNLHPRVARWWVKLQDYDFSIEYRPGHKMQHIDYLSRNPVNDDSNELKVLALKTININKIANKDTLREFQQSDTFCKQIFDNPDCDHNLTVEQDMIVTKTKPRKYFVPIAARLLTMTLYHDESSHIGWDKCIQKIREDLYWPKMGKCLKKYINHCRACTLGKSHTGPRRGFCQQGEKPDDILETWHIDHAGPLVKSNGCTQILVIIDAFSKLCRLQPIPKKTSECSIQALLPVFEELGRPRRIVADRAAAFTSTIFQNFMSEQQVELHHIATGVPRGNAQVERLMRTMFNLLRATLTHDTEIHWTIALPAIEDNLNVTVHSVTGYSPAVLHFGTNPRLAATRKFLGEPPNDSFVDPEEAIPIAQQRMKKIGDRQAQRFNETRRRATLFKPGDVVAIEDSQLAGGGKLRPRYKGPYTIQKVLPHQRYLLHKKGRRTTVAAHDQLRPWSSQ